MQEEEIWPKKLNSDYYSEALAGMDWMDLTLSDMCSTTDEKEYHEEHLYPVGEESKLGGRLDREDGIDRKSVCRERL